MEKALVAPIVNEKGPGRNVMRRYNHSLGEAAEYLRMTLQVLGQYKLPTDPVNYTVWYEYNSKMNPMLLTAVEDSLSSSRAITQELTESWFHEHVIHQGEILVQSIKADLLKILDEVFGNLSTAGIELSDFGKSLSRFSSSIEQADDKEAIQISLKGLLLEVKSFEQSSKEIEQRLKHANEEVKSLQLKLEMVEQHATTDALTNLLNRRFFEEKLTHHMARNQKIGGNLQLIFFDIDHFKVVNDTHGHLTGDDLLRIVAKTLKDYVKGKDIVCRFGGEEFLILLPDTPLQGATVVAEKIRQHFDNMTWKQKKTGISLGKITLSAGVATHRPGESTEAFVNRADAALYRSKKMGRNRVTVEK